MGSGKPKPAVRHQNNLQHVRSIESFHDWNTCGFQLRGKWLALLQERQSYRGELVGLGHHCSTGLHLHTVACQSAGFQSHINIHDAPTGSFQVYQIGLLETHGLINPLLLQPFSALASAIFSMMLVNSSTDILVMSLMYPSLVNQSA